MMLCSARSFQYKKGHITCRVESGSQSRIHHNQRLLQGFHSGGGKGMLRKKTNVFVCCVSKQVQRELRYRVEQATE